MPGSARIQRDSKGNLICPLFSMKPFKERAGYRVYLFRKQSICHFSEVTHQIRINITVIMKKTLLKCEYREWLQLCKI